jgi:hypothetical protein
MPADITTRTPRFAALALPLLALLVMAPAAAGPPEGVSGRMAFDEVADGLRRYRLETDSARRRAWLRRLAPAQDARVAVALGDALADADPHYLAAWLLCEYYVPDAKPAFPELAHLPAAEWWEQNEPDLRRRAKLLPR